MPAVQSGLVLVTGASGFIAVNVVKELLSKGYKVRGTVRSKAKGEYLVKKFTGGHFEYVIVSDVEQEDGFDESVQGVDAILHTASPFHYNVQDPHKDLVNPAINGTLGVFKSAKKNGDKVKRIVVTSSFASIVDTRNKPVYTYTEKDWNTFSPEELEKKGKDVDATHAYRSSKVLAERAAWKFVEDEKPSFDLVTLCPPFVLGPIEHQVTKPESLNTSVAGWYGFLSGKKTGDDAQGGAGFQVDVRDLATAHVQAISVEEAGKNRFAISNQAYTWQECLDIANKNSDVKKAFPKLPVGKPGAGAAVTQNILDSTKSKQILQLKYTSLEKTIIDMSLSLAKREESGWSETQ